MASIQITLPDGSVQEVPQGTTPADIARKISPRLADAALVARISDPAAVGNAQAGSGAAAATGVDDDFTALAPVEIQTARGATIVHWVRSASEPVHFSVPLTQLPLKVTLDPHRAVLRRP